MKKSDMRQRLSEALDLLEKAAKKQAKTVRPRTEAWVENVRSELEAAGSGGPSTVRLNYVRSRKTGRWRTVSVNDRGDMGKKDQEDLGLTPGERVLSEWYEVQAENGLWSEATRALAAGGGVRVRRKEDGTLHRTPGAPPHPKPLESAPAPAGSTAPPPGSSGAKLQDRRRERRRRNDNKKEGEKKEG